MANIPRKVAIFWDYASCPAPNNVSGHTLAANLRREGKVHGNVTLFKVYFGLPNQDSLFSAIARTNIRPQLSAAGVSVVESPPAGLSVLATDLLCFALDNVDTPHKIIVVSGNSGLMYILSALEARNINVGLIVPSGQRAQPLTAHGRVLHNWEQLAKDNFSPSRHSIKLLLPKKEEPNNLNLADSKPPASGKDDGDDPCEPIDVDEYESTIEDESRSSDVELIEAEAPAPAPAPAPTLFPTVVRPRRIRGLGFPREITAHATHQPRTAIRYEVTRERIPQPLTPAAEVDMFGTRRLFTTVHKLHMLEAEPPYADLIRDQEAIKVKTWRRQLKQVFYYETPQVPAKLEALFSKIEQYDKMTKNYLEFSRIGKLMTQISQVYLSDFDYRKPYSDRSKALLVKWQKIVGPSGV